MDENAFRLCRGILTEINKRIEIACDWQAAVSQLVGAQASWSYQNQYVVFRPQLESFEMKGSRAFFSSFEKWQMRIKKSVICVRYWNKKHLPTDLRKSTGESTGTRQRIKSLDLERGRRERSRARTLIALLLFLINLRANIMAGWFSLMRRAETSTGFSQSPRGMT